MKTFILAFFGIIVCLTFLSLPSFETKGFNANRHDRELSSITKEVFEKHKNELQEFKQIETDVKELNNPHKFLCFMFLIVFDALAFGIVNRCFDDEGIFGGYIDGISGIIGALLTLILIFAIHALTVIYPIIKVNQFNETSTEVRALNYVENRLKNDYCKTFPKDEICVISNNIENPSKVWTTEQKAAMWNKLYAYEKQLKAQKVERAERKEEERSRKEREVIDELKKVEIR